MFKAISGALSLLLIIVVLRMALPQVADLMVEIIVKILILVNNGLDYTSDQLPL